MAAGFASSARALALVMAFIAGAAACSPDMDPAVGGTKQTDAHASGDAADAGADSCTGPEKPHTWFELPGAPKGCGVPATLSLPAGVKSDDTGGITLIPSGFMQPVGALERITVKVRNSKGKTDPGASGDLVITAPDSIEVVKQSSINKGRATLTVRVKQVGSHDISAHIIDSKGAKDGRTGTLRLHGFKSAVPVWLIGVDDAEFAAMKGNPDERVWIDGTLIAEGKTHKARIRLHGGSSRSYPKKSLRLNLQGSALANGDDKIVLRAEWRDKSMLRLVLASAVLRELAGLPFSDLSYVHLRRTNGDYQGLMVRAERVAARFLLRRGRDPNGDLFEADPPFSLAVPGGNLTPLKDVATYTKVYQHHGGLDGYVPLIDLIEKDLQLTGKALVAVLEKGFKIDALMVYLAAMAVIQNHDHVKKNFYLHRDSDGPDCRWEMLAWDLDLSFGHLWTPEKQLLGETIVTDADPLVGRKQKTLFYNQLIDKVLAHPPWRAMYAVALEKILAGFDGDFVRSRAEQHLCVMRDDLLADRNKRSGNDELAKRIEELSDFAVGRRAFLKAWLAKQ